MLPLKKFGDYILIDELGRGGMAVVYHAMDTRTKQKVALKVLYESWMADAEIIKRFEREAELVKSLDHPNIVSVLDFGEHEGRMYLVMPFLEGGSLATLFNEPRNISLKSTAIILKQVADALEYAHTKGIIHRDIKLENILLDETKKPYLADFGIARLTDGTRLTATGYIAGTPLYMSPEQAMGLNIDIRSDVYGLAVMAYLMTTGVHPFTGQDALAVLNKHISQFAPLPSTVNPKLPPGLDDVLMKGLAKEPANRHQTATEFINDFVQAIRAPFLKTMAHVDIRALNPHNLQPSTPADSRAIPSAEPTQRVMPAPSRRNTMAWVAMLLTFVLALGAIGVVLAQSSFTGELVAGAGLDETAVRESIMRELTQTAQAGLFAQTQIAELTTTPQQRATLPPTWTFTPTFTITPTPTITQTPPPSPTQQATSSIIIADAIVKNDDGAPMRSGASGDFAVLGLLPKNTELSLVGRNANALWVEARTDEGFTGWVEPRYLNLYIDILQLPITWKGTVTLQQQATPTLSAQGSNPVVIIQPTSVIFSGSDDDSDVGISGNGGGGSSNPTATYTYTPSPIPQVTTVAMLSAMTNQNTYAFANPGSDCKVVMSIPEGTKVTLTHRTQNSAWVAGTFANNNRGWIRTSHLTIHGDVKTLPIYNGSADAC